MATMNEIYKNYAQQYDELIQAEDYRHNLYNFLIENFDWNNKTVYEAGIGTGRLSNFFISEIKYLYGFDREQHMLDQCSQNLKNNKTKFTLKIGDNLELPIIEDKVDVFIEGWSFGHTIVENKNSIEQTTEDLLHRINTILNSIGDIFIIETLGTNTEEPHLNNEPLQKFFDLLENKYSFRKSVINTSYKFTDYTTAARVLGFFFGPDMENDIRKERKTIVPEYTGVWHKKLND
jgi:hypothetical protein